MGDEQNHLVSSKIEPGVRRALFSMLRGATPQKAGHGGLTNSGDELRGGSMGSACRKFKLNGISVMGNVIKAISFKKLLIFFFFWGGLTFPLLTYAGYSITDKDGKVISEDPGNTLVTGPTNQTIILNDRGNHKVFEVLWDAAGRAVTVKGDRVHLKIHSSGKIEKWTEFDNMQNEQYPLFITPEIRIGPNPPRSSPVPQNKN
jgi:hypothetical protein